MSAANYGGFSVSAYVGGQLAEHYGYVSLQVFDAVMMTAALLTLLWLMRSSARVAHETDTAASISDAV